jgi:type IV pilus modification protein PilV
VVLRETKTLRRKRALKNKGFTLIEVLIAMTILGFGVAAFIALQTSAVLMRAHAQRLTTATQLTVARLDELMLTNPDLLANGSDNVTIGSVRYTRTWTITSDQPANGLTTIRARTNWWNKADPRQVELSAVVLPDQG